MNVQRGKRFSRCSCGHRIELVNGNWYHVLPYVGKCTDPVPANQQIVSVSISDWRKYGEAMPCCNWGELSILRPAEPED